MAAGPTFSGRDRPATRDETRDDTPASEHLALFLRFFRFGLFAWGGPGAQIEMLRAELVDRRRWVDEARFTRVLGIYQALPGPEALELCCYFGALRAGRPGGLLAGLAFMLPGLVFTLAAAWAYQHWGLSHAIALAALAGAQCGAAALVARATWALGRALLTNGWLLAIGLLSAVAAAAGVHFLFVLACAAAASGLAVKDRLAGTIGLVALGVGTLILGVLSNFESLASQAPRLREMDEAARAAAAGGPGTWELFGTGLKAGLLSFGGAYAALPFLRADSTRGSGAWMSEGQFLDGLAIGSVIPAPLLLISAFVGFLGGGLPGALAATAGAFLPAFALTLIGHGALERAVDDDRLHAWLAGLAAGAVGLIAATALDVLLHLPRAWWVWGVVAVVLAITLMWRSRRAVPAAMLCAAAAGVLIAP